MKLNAKTSAIIFSLLFILCGCGSGLDTVSIDSNKPFNFRNYNFHSPTGDDWECQSNEEQQSVMFYRQSDDAMQYVTGNRRETFINVYRDSTTIPTKNMDREEFVRGFMENEFRIMETKLSQTIYGSPVLIARDSIFIQGKTFYQMNYRSSGYPSQGFLYVYLPNHFKDTSVFYLFVIEEYGGENFLSTSYDFTQLNNILTSFNCDED